MVHHLSRHQHHRYEPSHPLRWIHVAPIHPVSQIDYCLKSVCLYVCLSVCLLVWAPVRPSVCLSSCLSFYMSVCLTIYLSVYMAALACTCIEYAHCTLCHEQLKTDTHKVLRHTNTHTHTHTHMRRSNKQTLSRTVAHVQAHAHSLQTCMYINIDCAHARLSSINVAHIIT